MKNKGITLVSLVITIILLLILAGISIATLTGSGLFEKAKLAEQKSKEEQEKENSILTDYENKIQQYITETTITSSTRDNSFDLLWTNENPNNVFSAQTIELDLLQYEAILIYVKPTSTANTNNYNSYAYGKIGETIYCVGVSKGTGGWYGTFRPVEISVDGVKFERGKYGQGNSTYDNDGHGGIPLYIWGIKKDIYNTYNE